MSSPQTPPGGTRPQAPARDRPPLRRASQGRLIAGVCRGLANHLGIHPLVLRVAIIVLTALGGAGALVYAFLWATIEPAEDSTEARSGTSRWADPAVILVASGALVVIAGLAALAQSYGLNLRLNLTVPVLVLTVGAVFVWSQLDAPRRDRILGMQGVDRRQALGRLVLGLGLVVAGLIALTIQGSDLSQIRDTAGAVLLTLMGVGLLAAPYIARLWRDLREEQAGRVREQERADIAAHLHDSVLQTLALIQRRADDPVQVARLARAQERELRGWLYTGPIAPSTTLAGAVAAVGHEVEDLHGVPIELVVTGDHPLDENGHALVSALREALLNAVRHGAPPVSAYVEAGPTALEAFVRDHGPGFDPDDVPADRLGVRESIVGRMQRHGGTARVRRLETGTEVSLLLPLTTESRTIESRPTEPRTTEPRPEEAGTPPWTKGATP